MTSVTPSLSTQHLSFGYDEQLILQDINLNFHQGELVGLIGPNGAGKSTLLRLLLGLDKVGSGGVTLMGRALSQTSRREQARLITLVPQDSQVNYAFSVEEVVAMGRNPWLGRFQPLDKNDLNIIQEAMHQTDVLDFAERPVNQLSGGERQRVLIARAIAQQTPIILLDEATANLDICHQLEVLELAKSLAQQGRLVIAAIHDLTMASRFCDRLLLLAQQHLQADSTPEVVITESNLQQFFNLYAEVCRPVPGKVQHRGLMITAIGSVKAGNVHR